jgi:hypothetical protein
VGPLSSRAATDPAESLKAHDMRWPRVQFTVRRNLSVIALIGVLIAIGVLWDRRIRRLDRMVLDQSITVESAKANYGNAVLTREAAEFDVVRYTEKARENHAEVSAAVTLDQSRVLATCDAEIDDAEEQFARIVQAIDDGSYVDGALSAPTAAHFAIRHFHESLNKRLAVSRSMPLAEGQGQIRMTLQANIEKARGEERLKKLILKYEKAYLNWLTRKRAHPWW